MSFLFIFQICIKNYDTYYKEDCVNKFLKLCKFDAYKKIYYYEEGQPIGKEFDFKIRNSLYEDAIDYIKDKRTKNSKFWKKISKEQDNAKEQFVNIIDKNIHESKSSKLDEKFGDSSRNITF